MPRHKKSNNGLNYIIDLLSKKREELISPFLDKEPEWIGLSFKYERNQSAFDLVRDEFVTLWIDSHITQLMTVEIPEEVKKKALSLVSELMSARNSDMDDSAIKHSILSTKLSIIKELLRNEDSNSAKYNELRYTYERDKALFEREFLKYENELKP